MTPRYLRLVLMLEFFIAVLAVFTAWSEIGGQAALDLMPWGWKFGLGLRPFSRRGRLIHQLWFGKTRYGTRGALSGSAWFLPSSGMGSVTYYYVLQEDNPDTTDEQESVTSYNSQLGNRPAPVVHSHIV